MNDKTKFLIVWHLSHFPANSVTSVWLRVLTFSATRGSAMIQSALEAVSRPRMSLLWSCVVPGSRVTLALMVPILIIHHSGTLGRIQTAFWTPRLETALAAFWLARLRSWNDSLRSSSEWSGLTYHRAVLSLHNINCQMSDMSRCHKYIVSWNWSDQDKGLGFFF